MFEVIKDLFGAAKDTKSMLGTIGEERRKTRGIRNAILSEAEFNMGLILDHYLTHNVDADKVIRMLKIKRLATAIDTGFDFKKIKKGKIDARMIAGVGFLKHFVGSDCESLLKNIRFHVEQLKILPALYNLKKAKDVNVKRRLENLGARYVLFTKFLSSA
jgi:hypothetical protein